MQAYDKAVVVQTFYKLEDSCDFEGMLEAKKVFQEIVHHIGSQIKEMYRQ